MGEKVAVLMSTYNGGKFLKEQINSIFASLNKANIVGHLIIRDDGSNDNTLSIITEFQKKNYQIKIIDTECNLGFKLSFWNLLKSVDNYDYYFFSDQDDIWDINKVNLFIEKFKKIEKEEPCAVYSDLLMFGNVLNHDINESDYYLWSHDTDGIETWMFTNTVTGASLAINKYLRQYLIEMPELFIESEKYHDWFIAKVSGLVGSYGYINYPLTHYRQHYNNQSKDWSNKSTHKSKIIARTYGYLVSMVLAKRLIEYVGVNDSNSKLLRNIDSYLSSSLVKRTVSAIKLANILVAVKSPRILRMSNFVLFSMLVPKSYISTIVNKKIINQVFQDN